MADSEESWIDAVASQQTALQYDLTAEDNVLPFDQPAISGSSMTSIPPISTNPIGISEEATEVTVYLFRLGQLPAEIVQHW